MSEIYTPGHTQNATNFMEQRTLSSHGAFFQPYLKPGMRILDCGCGPGSITRDIAQAVGDGGYVIGIDFGESQVELARQRAQSANIINIEFQQADVTDLPFDNGEFDAIFSHALLEHLSSPSHALSEFYRVLRPNGIAAICSPDWHGFLLAPPSDALEAAIDAYEKLQLQNGGDVYVGAKFGDLMQQTGFIGIQMSARYECYERLDFIGEYLALQLEKAGEHAHVNTLRTWYNATNGMFAQAWVACVGRKGNA